MADQLTEEQIAEFKEGTYMLNHLKDLFPFSIFTFRQGW
jgi:hypothetical protein